MLNYTKTKITIIFNFKMWIQALYEQFRTVHVGEFLTRKKEGLSTQYLNRHNAE